MKDIIIMRLTQLVELLGGVLHGSGDVDIVSIASISDATSCDITFALDKKYELIVNQSAAAAVIVSKDYPISSLHRWVVVDDVHAAYEQVLELFAPQEDYPAIGIDTSAVIAKHVTLGDNIAIGAHVVVGENSVIGDNCIVGPGTVIGKNVEIGNNCILGANVVLCQYTVLGLHVIIQNNTTIGSDGFGYRFVNGEHRRIKHIGSVKIDDFCEIGSNCCIDKAKMGVTVISKGTKVDNLVQIGHNCHIGEHCVITAQSGLAGSVTLGNYVVMAGQTAVSDHCTIGDKALLGARAVALSDIPSGVNVMGMPAYEMRQYYKTLAAIKKLPALIKEVKALKKQLEDKHATTEDNQ